MAEKKEVMQRKPAFVMPEGFVDAAPPKAWAIIEEGVTIQGIVLERTERGGEDKGKWFTDVKITVPHGLMVQIGPKEEHAPVPATAGMVVSLDDRARFADALEDMVEDADHEWEAIIYFAGKRQHPKDRSRTIWNISVGKKQLRKRQ